MPPVESEKSIKSTQESVKGAYAFACDILRRAINWRFFVPSPPKGGEGTTSQKSKNDQFIEWHGIKCNRNVPPNPS